MLENFLDLLYPRRCAICDGVLPYGQRELCGKHKALPYVAEPVCFKCGKEIENPLDEYCFDCQEHERHFERGFPVFNYEEPVKSAVLAIKYNNKQEYCEYYGKQMAMAVRPHLERTGIDGVTYVPIHKKKLKKRGYNQAYLLAKVVARELELPLLEDVIVREKETSPQKQLDNLERANNIKSSIVKGWEACTCKNILLVDDIYTTGATVDACAYTLKNMGVEKVYFSTVCIGRGV